MFGRGLCSNTSVRCCGGTNQPDRSERGGTLPELISSHQEKKAHGRCTGLLAAKPSSVSNRFGLCLPALHEGVISTLERHSERWTREVQHLKDFAIARAGGGLQGIVEKNVPAEVSGHGRVTSCTELQIQLQHARPFLIQDLKFMCREERILQKQLLNTVAHGPQIAPSRASMCPAVTPVSTR
ncbi:uncharacterized protein LOC143522238 [Brachyhypopomus gauderio]|uniref:uncharacterized protein LOC143522238 n=1 Tax=Brachyhypopomus gauderio TaxID=698409 RepID=UPI004041DA92